MVVPARAATVTDVRSKMGSRFEITAVDADEQVARGAVDSAWAEVDRIEALISSWQATSETSAINRAAGQHPVAVSQELFNLIRRSVKLSRLTHGAFDITFAGVGQLWDFEQRSPDLPDPLALREALSHVGWERILKLDSEARTVFLTDPQARIGFGAIGKGYAANRAVGVLRRAGIQDGVVSAGGDLVAFGEREDGSSWDIGIAHPRARDQIFARLPIQETAVVTSGDYESFFMLGGKRFAHILDPETGYPVDHLQSVTIVCPDAELADGLATAIFVMGPKDGMALIEQLNGIEALLVDAAGQLIFSDGLRSRLTDLEGAS